MSHSFLQEIRKWGDRILIIFCLLEIVLFFSSWNIAGCAMTAVSWYIFSRIFLKRHIIILHPFSFLVFLSMSMYRILPLFATLLEGKPISYKFENAIVTFTLETLLYMVSALAFYFTIKSKPRNNCINRFLYQCGFYKMPTPKILWALGFMGLAIRFIFMSVGSIEMGNVIGKFFITFTFFQYAPIILLFPNLYNPHTQETFRKNKSVIFYTCLLILLSFSGNSREALLVPIGTVILLFSLSLLRNRSKHNLLSKKIVVGIAIACAVIMPMLSDVSDAMLINRDIRSEVSRKELFARTLNTFLDKEKLAQARSERESDAPQITNYKEGWTEEYLSNFAFNRYCNMRVSDITLYHASQAGFGNPVLYEDFFDFIMRQFPTPVLNFFGFNIDKSEHLYSRADLLYAVSTQTAVFSGFRVTSHVADGLVTFGYLYFIIQFILFFIQFKLLDCYLFYTKGGAIYSIYGMVCIFDFLGMFRNANGCLGEVAFIIRGFVQSCLIFIIAYNLIYRIFRRN